MAGPKAPLTPKQQALHDLALARSALGPQWQQATAFLRPAALIQSSVQKHRVAWAAGALVTGFVAVRLLLPSSRRKNERDSRPKSDKKSGLIALIANPLFGLASKAALSFVTTQVQNLIASHPKDPRSL
jgi:threonine/homoserine/homoserine lactone efflux protein